MAERPTLNRPNLSRPALRKPELPASSPTKARIGSSVASTRNEMNEQKVVDPNLDAPTDFAAEDEPEVVRRARERMDADSVDQTVDGDASNYVFDNKARDEAEDQHFVAEEVPEGMKWGYVLNPDTESYDRVLVPDSFHPIQVIPARNPDMLKIDRRYSEKYPDFDFRWVTDGNSMTENLDRQAGFVPVREVLDRTHMSEGGRVRQGAGSDLYLCMRPKSYSEARAMQQARYNEQMLGNMTAAMDGRHGDDVRDDRGRTVGSLSDYGMGQLEDPESLSNGKSHKPGIEVTTGERFQTSRGEVIDLPEINTSIPREFHTGPHGIGGDSPGAIGPKEQQAMLAEYAEREMAKSRNARSFGFHVPWGRDKVAERHGPSSAESADAAKFRAALGAVGGD